MNGNVIANDLDLAYNQASDLYNLIKDTGLGLMGELGNNINSLKKNWKGSDATVHINSLIEIYGSINLMFVETANNILVPVTENIINIQRVRQSNGGSGSVGTSLANISGHPSIVRVEDTSEYYCTPAAITDRATLEGIYNRFNNLRNEFNTQENTLTTNWTDGSNQAGAVKAFNEIENTLYEYSNVIKKALDNLTTAVNNISQLNQ